MIRFYLQSLGKIAELQIIVERRCMPTLDVLWCRVAEPVHSSNVRQHWQQNCTAAADEGCTAGHQMNQRMLLNRRLRKRQFGLTHNRIEYVKYSSHNSF